MNISELSIRRPVLASVGMLIILIFGFISYTFLGVREYPSVDNPIISVNVSYPGANADVILNQITEPLEQNINGIPGIRSLSSTSSQGSCRITIEFELSVDLETAANDVRDKVSRAQRFLPRDCDPPTVSKADADATPIMNISIQSEKRSLMELSEIAELTVKERLQTIPDVSGVSIWGEKRYSMRMWLDPIRMAGYGVTPMDVKSALDKENVELPSGSIEGNTIDLSLRTLGLMQTAEEFNNVIIKRSGNKIVRFSDVGYAELAPEDIRSAMRKNRVPTVMTVIIPQPGANHIEIADEAYKRVDQLKKDLPEDVSVDITFDNTRFIRASINEVRDTIFIAFALVVFIIFFFLRDWRVTLIPVVVIPISLIGAFFIMFLAGFSINVLTMLAIVLSIGLVVDDAIVVTENIYVRIERGMPPHQAGIEGSKEIFFAVVSTTITLIAVFLPIVFMQGITGRLFKEFSIVIAGSVAISALAALSFSPMLATKMLKRRERKNWLYTKTEPLFEKLNSAYSNGLKSFLKYKWVAFPIIALFLLSIFYFWNKIPSELSPLEDRSTISVRISGQEGSTFEYIRDFADRIADITDSVAPEREATLARSWSGGGFINLILPDIRKRDRSQMEIAEELTKAVSNETQARVFVQQQSTFGGRRGGMPISYVLQAPSLEKLKEYIPLFMEEVDASPVFRMADVDLKFTKPEIRIEINRDKANLMGINTINIAQTLQYALSGQRMGYFYMNGKQYQILGEINRQQRNEPLDLKSIYIRNNDGYMIPLDNLVSFHESVAPPQIYRYNRFVSATVSSGLEKGYTIGDGLDEMDRIAAKVLDESFRTALKGESKEFRESSSSLMFAMILALIMIFLVLAAQFESFKDPFVIMVTVPLALAGALLFMHFGNVSMNIFSQIGMIMLIGLVAKNGILIVEFANQRQAAGMDKHEAIHSASVQRLRPILMTSVSTILGLLPLVFAGGEGANGRIAMGVAVVGGMLISTLMTLFIVPAIYDYISTDMSKKKIVAVLTAFLLISPSVSQAQDTLSLERCLQIGLESNYNLQLVSNQARISANNASRGNAGQLPDLSLGATYSGSIHDSQTQYSDGTGSSQSNYGSNNLHLGLNLNWSIFEGFSIRTTYARLQELKAMGELNVRLSLEDFIANLSAEYQNLIRQKIKLSNLKTSLDLSHDRLYIVEASYGIGAASGLDYQQAQVDYNADNSAYIAQQEMVERTRLNLNRLMALEDVERHYDIADSLIVFDTGLNKASLWEDAMEHNTQWMLALKNKTISELDYRKAQSRNYPYLRLNAGYGYRHNWYDNSGTLNQSQLGPNLGLSAGITLFDGMNRRREQRNALIEIENRDLMLEQFKTALKADLANLWTAYTNNIKLWEIEKNNQVVAQSNFEVAMERYRLRELSGIELREAQVSLLTAEERLLTTEYNIKLCEISLLQLSGRLPEYYLP